MGIFSGTEGVGILWIRREDYRGFIAIVPDGDGFPATHAAWQQRANEAGAFVEREGGKPVRVEAAPDDLLAWCRARGMDVDRTGRDAFVSDPANWPAAEKN